MGSSMDGLPPFPDDVPTVPIARISHQKLLDGDEDECSKVLKACQTDGFFYLDLHTSDEGRKLLDKSEGLLALSKEVFDQPLEVKIKFRPEGTKSLFGYKPAGTVKQTDKDKRPDTTEFFNIAKDHLFGFAESRSYPSIVLDAKPLCKDFAQRSHTCGQLVLGTLAKQLEIPEHDFTDKNQFDKPSGDHIRLTKKTPHNTDTNAIGLPSHTDFGSITILFNWLGGLQIQSHNPEKEGEWAYVKPLEGHAIINLGDAMVKFSNGTLKSAKHRVVPSPGEQVNVDRYSIVYFVRPADEALMEPVKKFRDGHVVAVGGKVGDDRVYTAGEWMIKRLNQMSSRGPGN